MCVAPVHSVLDFTGNIVHSTKPYARGFSCKMEYYWQLKNRRWELPEGGAIMGILNVTPDSFSDGGTHNSPLAALEHARKLIRDGADIIDVGGESTRPGSQETPPEEEIRRTEPVIRMLRAEFPEVIISIDTRHAETAAAALAAGADIVNDITALASPDMRRVCAESGCGVILMHMQGNPKTMQQAPHYEDVVEEVRSFFAERMQSAAADGIPEERICLDPGIGFGKTTEHNLQLIRHCGDVRVHNRPVLMALSRKSFMAALLGSREIAVGRPVPTVTMSLYAADSGADLHRVHDVAELRHALTLRRAFLNTH